jgi:zeaxanthin epoxidase
MVVEAPVRTPETIDRVQQVRERAQRASEDAAQAKGCAKADSGNEWWRQPLPPSPRDVSQSDPLRVIVAGGGVAGLVAAAACHAKGMKVAIFEQASQYAPYGGPIQIQSNALRALQRINPVLFEEIVAAGTVTADRVSGLKIGYKKGGAWRVGTCRCVVFGNDFYFLNASRLWCSVPWLGKAVREG